MASGAFTDEDFSCPVCYDIFRDPVVLSCSHTMCSACLSRFWEEKGARECPLCRKISGTANPPCNLVLRNLCEAFLKDRNERALAGTEILCSLHNEKLKLFCLDDQKPVCMVCRDSNKHKSHRFRATNEAALDLKEEITSKLKPLQENLRAFEEARSTCINTEKHTKFQAKQTEKDIKAEFAKLHRFLQDEEKARIAVLRKEEEQKSQMLNNKIKELNREIAYLTYCIRTVTQQIEADNITFLQMYKAALKRINCNLKNPETVPGALIDVAKHLGNMNFNVWMKMKDMVKFTPVILDPNTAHAKLHLSSDLCSVTLRAVEEELPKNPERFRFYPVLLGSEGFKGGRHYWDVDVGECEEWALGVCTETVEKGEMYLTKGVWRVWYCNGVYRADSAESRYVILKSRHKFKRIRVLLDWDLGRVVFYDPLTDTRVHTYTQVFTEKVYPVFANGSLIHVLRILPITAYAGLAANISSVFAVIDKFQKK